jgi:hypothetical protein
MRYDVLEDRRIFQLCFYTESPSLCLRWTECLREVALRRARWRLSLTKVITRISDFQDTDKVNWSLCVKTTKAVYVQVVALIVTNQMRMIA